MTGIVGFFPVESRAAAEDRLARMLAAVCDHESYQVDAYCDQAVALGRVSLGLLDRTPQPIWNEDESSCIVFEGELFERGQLRQTLEARGHAIRNGNSAELALHWFEEFGDAGLARLNGGFAFAIWNVRRRELVLANDRLGQRHLYCTSAGEHFAFACGVRGLLADERTPRTTDPIALLQALSFEHLLGDRTYLAGVKLLPPATVLRVSDEGCRQSTYWVLEIAETHELRSRQEYLEGMHYLLKQAVARQLPETARAGVNLSGGLDSRMLLGLFSELTSPPRAKCFTFGVPGCDDIRIGAELARAVNAPHEVMPLSPDYLLQVGETAVRLTDGMDSLIHVHTLASIAHQSQQLDVLYTGYYSDTLADSDGARETLVHFPDDTVVQWQFDYMHRLFPQEAAETIFTPEFYADHYAAFREDYRRVLLGTRSYIASNWMDRVEMVHRQRRLTQFGNDLVRWRIECRTPFCDRDLVDFCLAMPPALRVERFLFTETLKVFHRALAKVTQDRTGMPLVNDATYMRRELYRNLRWYLHRRGLGGPPIHHKQPYTRYDEWFRTALRPWVESVLLSKAALERGILRPEVLRRVVEDHMAGRRNYMREIGMLLSVELWHEQHLQRPARPAPAMPVAARAA